MVSFVSIRRVLASFAVLAMTTCVAMAGPPLICHPFDIGTARSLPFGDTSRNWRAVDHGYDRTRLVADTLALLTPETPVLVRMETLRRAIAYVVEDRTLAKDLLTAVQKRAVKVPKGQAEALALFDAAYLVDAFQQMRGHGTGLEGLAAGTDGYAMLRAAMTVRPDDPAMHLAAALMTGSKERQAMHATHVQKARAGGRTDALVARNVASHLVE